MMTWLLVTMFLALLPTWNAQEEPESWTGPGITILQLPVYYAYTEDGIVEGEKIYLPPSIGPPVFQYLGIPYAAPPVGKFRFRKTQPVVPWFETLDATKMPPGCIQYSEYPFPWYDSKDGTSEDCLYLNIWTVQHGIELIGGKLKRSDLAPVMVWIHGGGFTTGSIRQDIYNGSVIPSLAITLKREPMVFVTVNYRMGAFGFLNSGTRSAPGNVGLYDIVQALKWIKENILWFGGDSSRVTIAGQGSGAVAVGLLCVSPLAEGLFHRVIMESGSPAYLFAEDDTRNVEKSQQLAEALGCADEDTAIISGDYATYNPDKVVQCMRGVDAMTIAKTLNSFDPTSTYSFYPNYGDDILPLNAREALINGDFKNVEVLIGVNHDEGANLLTTAHPDVFGFFGEKDPEINKTYGESLLRDHLGDFEDPDAVVQYYLGDVEDDDYDGIRRQVYTAIGDYAIICPTVYFADSYRDAGNSVYFYFLNNRPITSPWAEWMGVVHFDEVEYLFGELEKRLHGNSTYRNDIILSTFVISYWNLFVDDRMQNASRYWPMYTQGNESVYGFFTYGNKNNLREQQIVDVPHRSNCDFFRGYFGFN